MLWFSEHFVASVTLLACACTAPIRQCRSRLRFRADTARFLLSSSLWRWAGGNATVPDCRSCPSPSGLATLARVLWLLCRSSPSPVPWRLMIMATSVLRTVHTRWRPSCQWSRNSTQSGARQGHGGVVYAAKSRLMVATWRTQEQPIVMTIQNCVAYHCRHQASHLQEQAELSKLWGFEVVSVIFKHGLNCRVVEWDCDDPDVRYAFEVLRHDEVRRNFLIARVSRGV